MDHKKIDLDAPLLSVRRFHSTISGKGAEVAENPVKTKRRSLPFYKSDVKSGPVRDPGVVPFVWEQSPGCPKEPPAAAAAAAAEVEEEDAFSDALETLSRADSGFMNCSLSGMTGIGGETTGGQSCFSTDPQIRDFMMGRFLPAAQAMTTTETGPHHRTRKAETAPASSRRPSENDVYRRPLPLPYPTNPKSLSPYPPSCPVGDAESDDEEEEEEGDFDDTRRLAMRGCGFLLPKLCLKSSFGGVRSSSGMVGKERPTSRRLLPPTRSSTVKGAAAQPEFVETWEEVYKYKLGHGGLQRISHGEEEGSKLTRESYPDYPVTYWSNSQSPNGSYSPYRRSEGDGVSPYRNSKAKGFLGMPTQGKVDKIDSFESSRKGSSSTRNPGSAESGSPAAEKTLYVDSVHKPEATRSSHVDKESDFAAESGRTDVKMVLEAFEDSITFAMDGLGIERDLGSRENSGEVTNGTSEVTEVKEQGKDDKNAIQPVLPPPLPKSPAESWLLRTLPAVSSNPIPNTFLGMRNFNAKNKGIHKSTVESISSRQIRFSEVLEKPIVEDTIC